MSHFKDVRTYAGSSPDKFFKTTLFESANLLLGLNCLDPGQSQQSHSHADQDKFYFVVEGEGDFTVGEDKRHAEPGMAVWAPAGVVHSVRNKGSRRLILLVGIAPAPAGKIIPHKSP